MPGLSRVVASAAEILAKHKVNSVNAHVVATDDSSQKVSAEERSAYFHLMSTLAEDDKAEPEVQSANDDGHAHKDTDVITPQRQHHLTAPSHLGAHGSAASLNRRGGSPTASNPSGLLAAGATPKVSLARSCHEKLSDNEITTLGMIVECSKKYDGNYGKLLAILNHLNPVAWVAKFIRYQSKRYNGGGTLLEIRNRAENNVEDLRLASKYLGSLHLESLCEQRDQLKENPDVSRVHDKSRELREIKLKGTGGSVITLQGKTVFETTETSIYLTATGQLIRVSRGLVGNNFDDGEELLDIGMKSPGEEGFDELSTKFDEFVAGNKKLADYIVNERVREIYAKGNNVTKTKVSVSEYFARLNAADVKNIIAGYKSIATNNKVREERDIRVNGKLYKGKTVFENSEVAVYCTRNGDFIAVPRGVVFNDFERAVVLFEHTDVESATATNLGEFLAKHKKEANDIAGQRMNLIFDHLSVLSRETAEGEFSNYSDGLNFMETSASNERKIFVGDKPYICKLIYDPGSYLSFYRSSEGIEIAIPKTASNPYSKGVICRDPVKGFNLSRQEYLITKDARRAASRATTNATVYGSNLYFQESGN